MRKGNAALVQYSAQQFFPLEQPFLAVVVSLVKHDFTDERTWRPEVRICTHGKCAINGGRSFTFVLNIRLILQWSELEPSLIDQSKTGAFHKWFGKGQPARYVYYISSLV